MSEPRVAFHPADLLVALREISLGQIAMDDYRYVNTAGVDRDDIVCALVDVFGKAATDTETGLPRLTAHGVRSLYGDQQGPRGAAPRPSGPASVLYPRPPVSDPPYGPPAPKASTAPGAPAPRRPDLMPTFLAPPPTSNHEEEGDL